MLLFCELNTHSNSCCCHYSTNKSSSLSLKMLIAQKRKYVHKTLREKCQSLKDLEKGMSNKDVAAKYGVPKNTLSTWVKSKEKLFLRSARKRKQRKTPPKAPYGGSRDIRHSCLQMVFKFAKSKRPIIWCYNPRKSKPIC